MNTGMKPTVVYAGCQSMPAPGEKEIALSFCYRNTVKILTQCAL